jgi:hypothetical protein
MSATFHSPSAALTGPAVARCVDGIVAATEDVFGGLATMASAMLDAWDDKRRFRSLDFAALRPYIFEQLDRHTPFDSAGYVMCDRALADEARHLDWWHRGPLNTYEELVLTVEPGAPDCYDYYTMEWFLAALDHQRRFASGPKIDLPCADVYIITFTYPVIADGVVLGVSAADVALSRFESKVRPPLQRLPAPAVLMNSERRVITSNDPTWTAGEKLRELAVADSEWQVVVPVTGDLGWQLAVAAPSAH